MTSQCVLQASLCHAEVVSLALPPGRSQQARPLRQQCVLDGVVKLH